MRKLEPTITLSKHELELAERDKRIEELKGAIEKHRFTGLTFREDCVSSKVIEQIFKRDRELYSVLDEKIHGGGESLENK